ncbi:type 1 glutamine amidotransferase [soil metagenome]
MTPPVRALFISHEADVLPGYLGAAAHRHGIAVDVCDLWAGDALPNPSDHDLIVPLGSAAAAYDDSVPWLAAELAYLRGAVAQDVPIFGVCFGAQALARALGGAVRAALRPEVGWYTVDTDAPDLIAPGPWLEWHFDALTPPPGARVLARSAAGVQAYAFGRHLAVQFHPEVTPAILDDWIAAAHDTLVRHGIDIPAFVEETRRRVPEARAAAHLLFDRALDHLRLAAAP